MKFGTYMFEAKKVPGFDYDLFRVKPEVGRRMPPKADMHSNIAIFGDNVTARIHPDWISQSDLGPAWRTNDNFNVRWEVLCATQPEHRAEQLDYIEDVARKSQGIWLNSIHFAEHGHCTCPRCKDLWKKSGLSWYEWRRKEVTEYMAQVSDRVRNRAKKKFVIGVLPDPVTNYERFGVNFDDLAPLTDEFLVVMFNKNYATPWYNETLTRNFKKLFKDVKLNIALYVIGPGDDPKETPTPRRPRRWLKVFSSRFLPFIQTSQPCSGHPSLLPICCKCGQEIQGSMILDSPVGVRYRGQEFRRFPGYSIHQPDHVGPLRPIIAP